MYAREARIIIEPRVNGHVNSRFFCPAPGAGRREKEALLCCCARAVVLELTAFCWPARGAKKGRARASARCIRVCGGAFIGRELSRCGITPTRRGFPWLQPWAADLNDGLETMLRGKIIHTVQWP